MCGRAACGLQPDEICRACGHDNKGGKRTQPEWRDPPGGQKYAPSYNICPSSYMPVMVSKEHFTEPPTEGAEEATDGSGSEWVVQPMQWGLVPFWHTGDPKSTGYKMTNARSDGMLTKRSYKTPLDNGRRCVALVEGYFEWQLTADGKKQPYYIYFPPESDSKVQEVNKNIQEQADDAKQVWTGKRLLTMAGLFDVWKPKEGDPLYTFSVITVESHKNLSWLHERMPAILNGEEEVRSWLNFGTVPLDKAVKLIRPVDCLDTHPVSSAVGDVRNKTEDCIKPYNLEQKKKRESASSQFLKSWLKPSRKRPAQETDAQTTRRETKTPEKKPKLEKEKL